jgi:hypothetical protein
MDPLSIVSTVSALIITGTKVLLTVVSYVDTVRNVPAQVHALKNHLSALVVVLQQSQFVLGDSPDILRAVPAATSEELSLVLDGCMAILNELQALVLRFIEGSKGWQLARLGQRLQWAMKEKDVDALMKSLEMYKMTINLTLNLAI